MYCVCVCHGCWPHRVVVLVSNDYDRDSFKVGHMCGSVALDDGRMQVLGWTHARPAPHLCTAKKFRCSVSWSWPARLVCAHKQQFLRCGRHRNRHLAAAVVVDGWPAMAPCVDVEGSHYASRWKVPVAVITSSIHEEERRGFGASRCCSRY
jgi:hypothetical protein